jgi:hypothetical protein
MKLFNLEQALAGKKVITRQGREVTGLHLFDIEGAYSVYAVLEYGNVESFTKDGIFSKGMFQHDYDLFMAPETITKWANIYDRDGSYEVGAYLLHNSEADAKRDASDRNCITVPITFEI